VGRELFFAVVHEDGASQATSFTGSMQCRPAGTGEAASAGRPSGLAQALAAALLLLATHLATRPLWRLSGCCDAALGQPHSELTDDVMDLFLAPLKANRAPGAWRHLHEPSSANRSPSACAKESTFCV